MTTFYVVLAVATFLVLLALVTGLFSRQLGFSHLLVFLVTGVLAGSDGPLGVPFDNYALASALGHVGLALILLDGGLRTQWSHARSALWPAAVLATVGVAITGVVAGVAAAALFDWPWRSGLLLGVVVSSTDAAAVFTQLQGSGLKLPQRLAATIEMESAMNDPMAVFLTLSLIAVLGVQGYTHGDTHGGLLSLFLHQAGWGLAVGAGAALLAAWVLPRLPLREDRDGLGALLLTTLGLLVFGVTGALEGSGFLAVYVFGLIVGERAWSFVRPALSAMNAYTWLAQAGMFLLLGLLATPSQLHGMAWPAVALAVLLMVLARPLAVALCLAPFRFDWRERLFIGWVGLRGAVPIVLATYPVMAGVPGSTLFFNAAFVVVLASLLVQAPSLGWLARRLGLDETRAGSAPVPHNGHTS